MRTTGINDAPALVTLDISEIPDEEFEVLRKNRAKK
jgi:hypothetical protein